MADHTSNWTDERVEALKIDWAAGYSASEIARRIGNATRNSVIGKVTRLGLPGRKVTFRRPSLDPFNTEDRRVQRKTVAPPKVPPTVAKQWRTEPLPTTPATDVARVSTADLEANHCRWPVGDPRQKGFGYCGCNAVPGLPYCAPHAHRAYRPFEVKQNNFREASPAMREGARSSGKPHRVFA